MAFGRRHLRFGLAAGCGGRDITRYAAEHTFNFLAVFVADRAAHHDGAFGMQIGYARTHSRQLQTGRGSDIRIQLFAGVGQEFHDFLHF